MGLEYKIFISEDLDWFVAAKNVKPKPKVLYEGHNKEEAYESILKDLGIKVNEEERSMDGSYVPKSKDF